MSAIFTDLPDLDISFEKNNRFLQDVYVSEISAPSLTELTPPLEPAEPKPQIQQNNMPLTLIVKEPPPTDIIDITQAKTRGWIDITPFLTTPQKDVARKFGIPTSTLSKRWKQATITRKWPQKLVQKIDQEIEILLRNISPAGVSPEIETRLGGLLRRRQEELRPVTIRL